MKASRRIHALERTRTRIVFGLAASLVAGLALVATIASATAGGPGFPALQAKLAKYSRVPQFVAPGPAFHISKAKGKTLWIVPTSSLIPIVTLLNSATAAALKLAGVKVVNYTTKGTASDWVAGMNQAIAHKADAIVLLSIDPNLLGPQIKQAQAAHIPIIWTFAPTGNLKTLQPNVTASVPLPFNDAMRLIVDWAIVDSKGKADAKIIETAEVRQTAGMVKAMQDEFKTQCPTCKVESVLNAPIPDWATQLGSEVRSALIGHRKINYILPLYDGMEQFVLPAIRQVDASGRVKSASFNGTPSVLKEIAQGNLMGADAGQSNRWIGWATADQVLRVLTGTPPVADEKVPLRLWTKANIAEATGDTEPGYGTSYIAGYKKLWGLSK